MPDSCRDQTETEKENSPNIITTVSKFADENLTLIRSVSAGLAVAGVIIIARSIRLTTKFGSPSEIPSRFIERNVSIRGKVRSVTERGLEVEHIPIHVPILSPLLTKRRVTTPLHVRLAGVDLTPQGRDWLVRTLRRDETVWLRLISREDESLHCMVSLSGGFLFNTCVNEEILRSGLGRAAPLHGLDPRSSLYWRLHSRLLKCELRAEKKGRGLWKQESVRDKITQAIRNNSMITAMKRLIQWLSRTKDQ
ncbi:protein C3orf33-like [Silurus asotus]|uniref:Protein C3orf33-like n=1 Tax=Silurus asotus TaxID=30991 RepID=A0AAD5A8P3_SILAS|nr:protein C3orf33-like [Silurus asotus]